MNFDFHKRSSETRQPFAMAPIGMSSKPPKQCAAQPTRKILTLEIEVMEERIAPGSEDRWRWKWWGNRCETVLKSAGQRSPVSVEKNKADRIRKA